MTRRSMFLGLVLCGAVMGCDATDGGDSDGAEASGASIAVDSPRGALQAFLEAVDRGAFDAAAQHVDGADEASRRRGARRLRLLLRQELTLDVAGAAASAAGDLDDGRSDADVVGALDVGRGDARRTHDVVLRRIDVPAGQRWVFSSETMKAVDKAFVRSLSGRLLERAPAVLLRDGPAGLLWAEWIAAPLLVALAAVLGLALGRLLHRLLVRLAKKTSSTVDDEVLQRVRGSLALFGSLLAIWIVLAAFDLPERAWHVVAVSLRASLLLTFFHGLLRVIDVAVVRLQQAPFTLARPGSRALLPLGGRIVKVVVVVVAVVAVISALGYPVASLLAGLGIGGLALALAAQKTFENLFGAFAVGIDQPFREGDFVKVDDFVGTVEAIGLRSTRIRTLDRTVITLPNGQLAEKRVESFALRDRIRLFVTLGLVYSTTQAQMEVVLSDIVKFLKAHPKIASDASVVARFASFGPSSLDIEVMCWFETTDFDEFCALRTSLFLEFMGIVERAGSGFAFPTHTVHLAPTAVAPGRGAAPDEEARSAT